MSAVVGIVDYGMGNRRSVEKALEHVGARAVLSSDPALLDGTDGLILPGVGAFPEAMRRLRELELDRYVIDRAAAGVPLLGICLGMQLLFESSTEFVDSEGLGLLRGGVRELEAGRLKLPHIGWNPVTWVKPSALLGRLPEVTPMYHVHSFVADPADPEDVLGRSDYGEVFTTAVERRNVYGVQFHPEKSSTHGLLLLGNFAAVCAGVAA